MVNETTDFDRLHHILFLGIVPLKPGEASDPNSPQRGYRVETEAEAIARIGYDPRKYCGVVANV
jgi:hypothetical protein